jgi:adenylate cyclase
MAKEFAYTALAHRYTARFPVLTYVGTQVNFWIIANLVLSIMMYLHSQLIIEIYKIPMALTPGTSILIALISGTLYGIILGLTGYYLDRNLLRRKAVGKVIILRTLISFAVLILLLTLLKYVFFDIMIKPSLNTTATLTDKAWESLFLLLAIYYFCMMLVISFINHVNKKYGPGILIPLLLGRYRSPKEEQRIFMFMDLRSSTATAEKLGHLRYSTFIRDCFADINEVLYPYCAQVYQYVGDEIVVTWPEREGIRNHFCIEFYFACQKQFEDRADYYMTNYGLLPDFKAGAHAGTVTTVEIGEYKRDLAYHGDTLNTAARIQSVCNDLGKRFIVSKVLLDKVGPHPNMQIEPLGGVVLKGKTSVVELCSVEWK